MAVKIKFAGPAAFKGTLGRKLLLGAGLAAGVVFLICAGIFGLYYIKYGRIVDQRMEKPLFTATAKIYAAPPELRPGQKFNAHYIAQELRSAGYSVEGEGKASPMGTFSEGPESLTVHPGAQSYHAPEGATITFDSGAISAITGDKGQQLSAYELEPLLITDLSDQNRSKRRLLTYDQIPHNLVNAVVAIEDRRFFYARRRRLHPAGGRAA